jgi:hypothetical protein
MDFDIVTPGKGFKFEFGPDEFSGMFGFMHCHVDELGIMVDPERTIFVSLISRAASGSHNTPWTAGF